MIGTAFRGTLLGGHEGLGGSLAGGELLPPHGRRLPGLASTDWSIRHLRAYVLFCFNCLCALLCNTKTF